MCNIAIREGLVDKKHYPFGRGKMLIQLPTTHKVGLNQEEIELIEQLELKEGNTMVQTKHLWLFSFYSSFSCSKEKLRISFSTPSL